MCVESFGKPFVYLQLPSWRPGRYELANYAKNIQYWKALDSQGRILPFRKISKDCWEVTSLGLTTIEIHYNYYAFQLDAGGSYFDETQVYINPVNCLLYVRDRLHEPCSLTIDLPANYRIACALKFDLNRTTHASNYHELADSPIIASHDFQQMEYTVENVKFRITFQGNCKPNWNRLISDFRILSREHIHLFGGMPVQEFHFLFQISSYEAYHGVEHAKSCLIHFGPGERLDEDEVYKSFLGICSHELFHCWNIKAIRPCEFIQYDYSKELYSHLGYMAEGVTTYYGDLQLLRCGLYNWDDYSNRLSNNITNYFHTEGRNYQSLAASSFESWLDGYKDEAPDRKVSMYVKGMLFTLLKDIAIRSTNRTGRSMDWVMQTLYRNYGLERKGYSITDIEKLFLDNTEDSYRFFFKDYFWGIAPLDNALQQCIQWLGCKLLKLPSPKIYERFYGLKITLQNSIYTIIQIAPGSPSDLAHLSLQDEILAINQQSIDDRLETLFTFYHGKEIRLTIRRRQVIKEISLNSNGQEYFPIYKIDKQPNQTPLQKNRFGLWSGQV